LWNVGGPNRSCGTIVSDPLPRTLGVWSFAALTTGLTIGAGIFQTPAVVAGAVPSPAGILLVWLGGGIVTLCLALCIAELGTMFPRAGGLYVFLKEAFGPLAAFVYGWSFLLINPASWAAIAIILAQYLAGILHLSAKLAPHIATAAIIVACAINYVSVRAVALIQKVVTPIKALVLIGIALVILFIGRGSAGAFHKQAPLAAVHWGSYAIALAVVLWAYDGIASASAACGEVTDPRRGIPRALLASVAAITFLYLLANAAFLYVLPLDTLAASRLVASDAVSVVAGPYGSAVISGCVVLSASGALIATSLTDPRVFFAMARDGLFFKVVGKVHPVYRTPHIAVLLSGALAVLYVEVRTFEQLAVGFILGIWLFYAAAVAGLMMLRRNRPDAERPYRLRPYPLIPLLFLAGTVVLIGAALVQQPGLVLFNLLISASGVPIFYAWCAIKRINVQQCNSGGTAGGTLPAAASRKQLWGARPKESKRRRA
jgi:basic amino acid/polyamine antiporter, APA family